MSDSPSRRVTCTTHTAHECEVVLCRFDGPHARELFAHARPLKDAAAQVDGQADALYRALRERLFEAGASATDIVTENAFVRAAKAGALAAQSARTAAFGKDECRAAVTVVEQPPVAAHAQLEVSMHALVGKDGIATDVVGDGASRALCARMDQQTRVYAAGLGSPTGDAHAQTQAAFNQANALLQRAGMTFSNVARTWLHLPNIGRDYAALNEARRQFFAQHAVAPAPASTGIGGALPDAKCRLGLGFYAVSDNVARTVMTSPTLNEAPQYGADFVRGLKLKENNRTALMVSGTASIDEHGESIHAGDVVAQAERMLLNIRTLLKRQGAGFDDIVSAVVYVKDARQAAALHEVFAKASFTGFPTALVEARVCRPELLCETEVLALIA